MSGVRRNLLRAKGKVFKGKNSILHAHCVIIKKRRVELKRHCKEECIGRDTSRKLQNEVMSARLI